MSKFLLYIVKFPVREKVIVVHVFLWYRMSCSSKAGNTKSKVFWYDTAREWNPSL